MPLIDPLEQERVMANPNLIDVRDHWHFVSNGAESYWYIAAGGPASKTIEAQVVLDRAVALEEELQYAWTCQHGNDYRDHSCLECWGDGSETISRCKECGADTWHGRSRNRRASTLPGEAGLRSGNHSTRRRCSRTDNACVGNLR